MASPLEPKDISYAIESQALDNGSSPVQLHVHRKRLNRTRLKCQPWKDQAMSVNVLYRTSARATGGRDGRSLTLDGAVDFKLSTPKELGGAGGEGVNPEQLFAAGYAACFL